MRIHHPLKPVLIGSLLFSLFLANGCTATEKNAQSADNRAKAEMKTIDPAGLCPQVRGTQPAPEPFASMKNPLAKSVENTTAGKRLFHGEARPIPCEICHGFKGNGFGVVFQRMQPYPRDFTCYQSMADVSDGQLFWIIKHGSHGTRMKAYEKLDDQQVWQLVHYIRNFAE